jgi:hypothetical protein
VEELSTTNGYHGWRGDRQREVSEPMLVARRS